MKTTRSFWIALAASFVVGGCYSPKVHQKVPLASDSADREAKLFKTHSDKAVVYYVRDMTLAGDGLTFEINANYQLIGRLSPKNYIRASASPGDYSLACDVTYMGSTKTRLTASKKLNFEAGKIYFIDVVKVDYVGCDFEFLNDTEGRSRVTAYKMAEAVTPVGRSNPSSTVENKSTATEKQYEAEALARLKNYEIFTAVSFSATVDSRYKGYSFGDLFSKARVQLQPKLEAASLKQLRNFEAIYGFELMPEDKALVKKLIVEKEQAQAMAAEQTSPKEVSPQRSQTRSSSSKTQPAKTDVSPRSVTTEVPKAESPKVPPKPVPAPNPF